MKCGRYVSNERESLRRWRWGCEARLWPNVFDAPQYAVRLAVVRLRSTSNAVIVVAKNAAALAARLIGHGSLSGRQVGPNLFLFARYSSIILRLRSAKLSAYTGTGDGRGM